MAMKKKRKKGREQPAIKTSRETPKTSAAGFRHKLHEHPQLRKALPVMLVLVAVNLFIYAQVRYFEFIGWDDPLYITQNTEVSKGLSWQGAQWALTTGHAANWHPLTWLSHMLDVHLFGLSPGPIHFTNVLFHTANSLLLFWILFRMTSAAGPSAFVAGLFAVHPLHVESVAWVAERKDVLSTALLLLTIWAYITYVRKPVPKQYLLVHILFALALMAKPMVITLPIILLILDVWPLGRGPLEKGQWRVWRQLLLEKLALMIMAIALGAVTLMVQRHGGTMAGFEVFPLGTRVANAGVSYVIYLGKMLWPSDLSAFYPLLPLPAWAFAGSVLSLIGISFLVTRNAARHPYFLVGWSWYLVTLLPVIGLIQVGDQARADRYTYVPLIGIFVVIAWSAQKLLRQNRRFEIAAVFAACTAICVLALSARSQVGYWKNSFTLWQHALESTTRNVHANVNFGLALMDRGEVSSAIAHYNEALRIAPNFAEAHNALGAALFRQNKVNEAGGHFEQALRLKPSFPEAQSNMGIVLARQGRAGEALSYFTRALEAKPSDEQLHHNIGLAFAETGHTSNAIAHFSEAIKIKPGFAEPHIQLGNIFFQQGEADRALAHYREAIRIKPDSADAHTNLGICLMNKGLVQEAAAECREALRLNSAVAEAHYCLGNVFVQTGREDESIDQYEQALRLKPAYAEAHNNLAMILINKMQDNEALVHLTEAVRIKPDYVDALNNLAIALINTGNEREAIQHLRRILVLQPGNEHAKEALIVAQARQSRK
jgi:Flp pilus assembly protein TadD